MDEKLWNFATTVGGTTGVIIVGLLAAWKVGLLKWVGTFMESKISNEAIVKTYNDVNADIIKRLTAEIADLKQEIKGLKDDHKKELDEKKQIITGLEAQYDLIAAQYREAKRNLGFNEADLLTEHQKLRQQMMELETELAKARKTIDTLSKELDALKNNGYTPISGD